MEVIHERVAGLDVHKDSVVACGIMSGGKAKGVSHLRVRRQRSWRPCGIGSPHGNGNAGGDGGDRGLLAADLEDPASGRSR